MSPPCPIGCTCRRHTRARPGCEPGCQCKRHKRSAEAIAATAAGLKGRAKSPEHNAAVSEALTGRSLSADHVAAIRTHGLSYHPHYHRWKNIMARCYNPDHPTYPHYGGRNIKVTAQWHDLAAFCTWMDTNMGACPKGMSIERIDNDRGYEPGNLRWATQSEQNSNRRRYRKLSGR